jgi:hypothetical protein
MQFALDSLWFSIYLLVHWRVDDRRGTDAAIMFATFIFTSAAAWVTFLAAVAASPTRPQKRVIAPKIWG